MNKQTLTSLKDAFIGLVAPVNLALIILFGVLPLVVVPIVGVFQNTIPSTELGGWVGESPGYPFMQPPFWLLWIPASLAFAWALVSLPVPGKKGSYYWGARIQMTTLNVLGSGITFIAMTAYSAPYIATLVIPLGMWLTATVLVVIRGLLGVAKLVPQDWI